MAAGPNRSTSLNATRRERELADLRTHPQVDVLVIGGGVTGAGTALDAASRGLSVVLVEKHDLAFGTSRWSSKLIHGGLRYLISGSVGVALESAVERDILLRRTAPHLVHAEPSAMPIFADTDRKVAGLSRAALAAGDVLRLAARTPSAALPRSRRISAAEVHHLAPGVRSDVTSGLLGWDGHLVDDARLVVALARTAAGYGAQVLTRCSATEVSGREAVLRDDMTGHSFHVRARAVINATGVWAGTLDSRISLRPSRGTHLVLRDDSPLGGLRSSLTLPVPGEVSRFALVLPQPDGRVYVGLTDEPVEGPIPDVPQPTDAEIDFLLGIVNHTMQNSLSRDHVAGAFAGLRPLLDSGAGRTSDLSRRHAVLTSPNGLVTIVGGKLTTYRRMAEDAVDAAIRQAGLTAGPCVTRRVALTGAGSPRALAQVPVPARLVHRYGVEASRVVREAGDDPAYLEPLADGVDTIAAELRFGVRHEGALDVDDLLHRRTRIGLIPGDADKVRDVARAVLSQEGLGQASIQA